MIVPFRKLTEAEKLGILATATQFHIHQNASKNDAVQAALLIFEEVEKQGAKWEEKSHVEAVKVQQRRERGY